MLKSISIKPCSDLDTNFCRNIPPLKGRVLRHSLIRTHRWFFTGHQRVWSSCLGGYPLDPCQNSYLCHLRDITGGISVLVWTRIKVGPGAGKLTLQQGWPCNKALLIVGLRKCAKKSRGRTFPLVSCIIRLRIAQKCI